MTTKITADRSAQKKAIKKKNRQTKKTKECNGKVREGDEFKIGDKT